jgi:hypothetical protein
VSSRDGRRGPRRRARKERELPADVVALVRALSDVPPSLARALAAYAAGRIALGVVVGEIALARSAAGR